MNAPVADHTETAGDVLVSVAGLVKHFEVSAPWLTRLIERQPRRFVPAVDGVDFSIPRGRTLGLVGESGSGKSTVARLLVGLMRPDAGALRFDGLDMRQAFEQGRGTAALRRRLQMVFQDPQSSLNPRWRVRDIVAEPLVEHGDERGRADVDACVADLLRAVGLSPSDATKFSHQFSGGQRQRLSIARALAVAPEFLVCDEPTSALDVSVQAQVLNLLKDLKQQRGLTTLFISHNLAVVRQMADEVGVMYLGRLVELSPQAELFRAPRHPYTRLLLEAIPDVSMRRGPRAAPAGDVPNPLSPPSGCAFHPRCPHANERCRGERPAFLPSGAVRVACHAVEEGRI